ncbi:MAG: hypothetical protein A2Y20_04030 [Firmicutes bacterium GWF2_51_9]|nr:MAG: hypothetical protein A2Y20_04030 [Firmicutes bacterium GWF2_51_9]OGS57978.1 MAG: hypothetical protein A2Y19_07025 [Firmicutes bacterium GWE2_51_13]
MGNNVSQKGESMKTKMKVFLTMILLTTLFSSCAQKESIKIGFAGGLSASSYDLGVSGMYGAMMAVEVINDAGGVLGRKLEIEFKNDFNTPSGALKVDKEFKESGIEIIIGHMISGVADASINYANENGLLLVSPTIAAVHLGQLDDALIRLIPDNQSQAEAMQKIFAEKKSKKIAIVLSTANYTFAQQIADHIRKENLDPNIVIETILHQGDQEEAVHSTSLYLSAGAFDGIALLLSAEQVAKYAQHFRKFDYHPTVVLPAWSMTNELFRLGGKSVEGYFCVNYVDFGTDDLKESFFVKEYYSHYGVYPTFASILSYDAVFLIAEAMTNSKSTDHQKVKLEILSKTVYRGIGGNYELDRFGDTSRPIHTFIIEKGEYVRWGP